MTISLDGIRLKRAGGVFMEALIEVLTLACNVELSISSHHTIPTETLTHDIFIRRDLTRLGLISDSTRVYQHGMDFTIMSCFKEFPSAEVCSIVCTSTKKMDQNFIQSSKAG
jgi:hypothetical protein